MKISVADKHRPYLDGFSFAMFSQNPTNKLQFQFAAVNCRPPETGGTEPLEHVFKEVLFPFAFRIASVPLPTRQERFPGAARFTHSRTHTVLIPSFRVVVSNVFAPSRIQFCRQGDPDCPMVLVRGITYLYRHLH